MSEDQSPLRLSDLTIFLTASRSAGTSRSTVVRQLLDRFADDVEVHQDGVHPDIVHENLFLRAALGVPDDPLATLLDVFEKQQRITRHGSPLSPRTA